MGSPPADGAYYIGGTCFREDPTRPGAGVFVLSDLAPGASCSMVVGSSLSNTSVQTDGEYLSTITLATDQGNATFSANAKVGPIDYPIQVTPAVLSLARASVNVATNVGTLTLRNPAPVATTISALTIPAPFQRVGGTCPSVFPATLAIAATCTLELVVPAGSTPSANEGTRAKALVTIKTTAPLISSTGNLAIALSLNTGADPLTTSVSAIDFGNVTSGASVSRDITINNSNAVGVELTALSFTGNSAFARVGGTCPNTLPAVLAASGSCTVTVRFVSPSVSGNYGASLRVLSASGSTDVILSGTAANPIVPPQPSSAVPIPVNGPTMVLFLIVLVAWTSWRTKQSRGN